MFLFLKSVSEEIKEFKIEKNQQNWAVQESPSKLKISSVFRMMEPFDRIKSVVKMEADEIKVTTTSQSGTIKIMTPSQINKPLDKVVSKNRGPPFIIGRVGNTTVKPIIRFLSNEPNKPTVTAHSSLKLLLHPKENEEISTARPSGAYVKHIENENRDLRKLLTDVRRESIGKSVEIEYLFN